MRQLYLGSKLVMALPMNRAEYNTYRGWELPANENGADLGYLVEYTDSLRPNHEKHAGYISWSPKEEFDRAYRSISAGLPFPLAIEALKKGLAIARYSWSGTPMRVYLVPANKYPAVTATAKAAFGEQPVPYNAYLALIQPDFTVSVWTPSCGEILAEDWYIVT